MPLLHRKLLVILALAALFVAGAAGNSLRQTALEEYPDAPFLPVGPDFPRLIPVRDEPSTDDSAAWESRQEELRRLQRFQTETGAIHAATPDERAAVLAAYHEQFVQARKMADKILAAHRDSVPALYALAQVEMWGEGNLPAALFLVRRARHLLEQHGRTNPADRDACEWYLRALDLESSILQGMDRNEDQIRVTDLLGQVYEPLPWRKTWPLIKLRRFDEARGNIDEILADGRCASVALNGLCALEDKLQRRTEAWAAGKTLVERCPSEPVFWSNYGLAAYNAFRFQEAETAFLEAGTFDRLQNGNPYLHLSFLYLQQARIPEAVDALKKAHAQRAARAAHTFSQDQAHFDMAGAMLMHVAGRAGDAMHFSRRAYVAPDRAGVTSIDERDQSVSNGLLYWTVLDARLQELQEGQAGQTGTAAWQTAGALATLRLEHWAVERRLRRQLTGRYLIDMIRPTVPGTPSIETGLAPWFRNSLIQIVPPGVAAAAIAQARRVDDLPQAAAYLDALDAEAALALNQPERAQQLGQQALRSLPAEGEKLLRARVQAVVGQALLQQGKAVEAREQWGSVLRTFPHLFRMLHISLPLAIQHDGSEDAPGVADALYRSPRFHAHAQGFPVTLARQEGRLVFQICRAPGMRHWEASVELQQTPEQTIARAAAGFHERLGQPLADLSQLTIDSLDGANGVSQFRDRTDRLLEPYVVP